MAKVSDIEKVNTDLEIEEHIDLHRKGWIIQRIGWIFIFLFVALAAFGLFGDGIASKTKLSGELSKINFDRYFRHEATMALKIKIDNSNGRSIVSFNNEYLKNFKLESILPEPEGNFTKNGEVHYYFAGDGDQEIVFYLIPQQIGSVKGAIRVNTTRYNIHQFIYP